ncbi:MAG: hypothetical protein QNJ13_12540 [Paracoccaceae bacterium]|nr:hypothetical protein [Paracoccaceae bacterium]
MFNTFLQPSLWRHSFLDTLGQHDLLAFQPFDPRFIRTYHRRVFGLYDTV